MSLGEPLHKLAREIEGVPKALMLTGVKLVKEIADREGAKDSGGDGKLSHMGGARLVLNDDLKVGTDQASVTLKPPRGSAGAWAVVTYPTKPHKIGGDKKVGRGKNQRTTGRRKIRIGNRIVTGPIPHPGTRGKGTFERVLTRSQKEVVPECEKALAKVVTKAGW